MAMRTVDRTTKVSRRNFLRTSAAAAPVAMAAGAAFKADAAWAADAKALTPHAMTTLARMARDIYPHDHLVDRFYIRAVTPWDDKAAKDGAVKAMLLDGVARIDSDANDRGGNTYINTAWEADRVALLQGIEHTPFFNKLRADLVVSLYNQPELWPKLGYEGSSAEHGGYLARGFNDIDWLPTV